MFRGLFLGLLLLIVFLDIIIALGKGWHVGWLYVEWYNSIYDKYWLWKWHRHKKNIGQEYLSDYSDLDRWYSYKKKW